MILTAAELAALLVDHRPGAVAADWELVAQVTLAAHRNGHAWAGLPLLTRELAAAAGVPAAAQGAGALLRLSGADQPGPLALAAATRYAAAGARDYGICGVGVTEIAGTGRLAGFAAALAKTGLVGFLAAGSSPWVAPFGGRSPAVGTNPFALAAPTSTAPIVIDAASSAITRAALSEHRSSGTPLPDQVALDAAGAPVTAPDSATALLPRGLLGSLVGLSVELVAGALLGMETAEPNQQRGILVLAIDPAAIGTDLAAQVDLVAQRWVAAGGRLPGAGSQLPETAEVDEVDWQALTARLRG